ncbi:hypothetical protein H2203_003635 [Taxawa tesnikishii (nom. ined.)]|nr:hypothetical protein H2203_003635 [Dothideales sp. JES 119]
MANETESATGITTRDIARVRALFMSSGVKARSLYLRAESPSPEPPAFLISAAAAAGKEVPSSLPRKCELICAGQLFSSAISARLTAYSDRIDHFRQTTTPALHTRLEELKTRVADELTPKIHVTADDADAFTAKLNSQQTLAVKQVHDAIDNVLRNRRRRLRWIRRAGYKVLEWAVLSLLWAVWLVVVMVKAVRGVFDFSVGVVRWIFFA